MALFFAFPKLGIMFIVFFLIFPTRNQNKWQQNDKEMTKKWQQNDNNKEKQTWMPKNVNKMTTFSYFWFSSVCRPNIFLSIV